MVQHIGIVACSAEGAALCYRTICVEGGDFLGPHAHPEVSMHTPSLAEYMVRIRRDDWQGVGELMLLGREARGAGADFLSAPTTPSIGRSLSSNRDRRCPGCTSPKSSLPRRSARVPRLGLLGTRWLVESEVYPEKLAARGLAVCARTTSSARKSIASSWTSWFTASSSPRRSTYFQTRHRGA